MLPGGITRSRRRTRARRRPAPRASRGTCAATRTGECSSRSPPWGTRSAAPFSCSPTSRKRSSRAAAARSRAAPENGLSHVTSGLLSELCDRFDDPSGVDTISRTVEKVESVKLIMQDNIETVLANTVQLEHMRRLRRASTIRPRCSRRTPSTPQEDVVEEAQDDAPRRLHYAAVLTRRWRAYRAARTASRARRPPGATGTGRRGDSPAARRPRPLPRRPTAGAGGARPVTRFARCLRGVISSEVAASDRRRSHGALALCCIVPARLVPISSPDARSPRRRLGSIPAAARRGDDGGSPPRQRRISCRWLPAVSGR